MSSFASVGEERQSAERCLDLLSAKLEQWAPIQFLTPQLDFASGSLMTWFALPNVQAMIDTMHRGRILDVWCDLDPIGSRLRRSMPEKLPFFEIFLPLRLLFFF